MRWLVLPILMMPLWADLGSVQSEPKPEKRAEKALDNADQALKTAQQTYQEGKLKETNAALDEIGKSVQLAYDSLLKTGKNPNRSPKNFKKAEIRTRELLRRLRDFSDQMSALDRDQVESVRASVQKVHEDLLNGIMGGKKKAR
jgi:DNA repair ATPase RecN